MKNTFFYKFLIIPFFLFLNIQGFSFDTAGGHTGNITSIIHKGDKVISTGDDGYIVIWDTEQKAAFQRFQLTAYEIQSAVSHPQKDEICIIEAGGFNNSIISVWNYTLKRKLFSLHSSEPVTFINYSANGSFIIAAGFNGNQMTLLNSETGQVIMTADIPQGTVSFAATGRSERNIFIYQSEGESYFSFEQSSIIYSDNRGQILYLDLDSGLVTSHFRSPGSLSNPVIFSNNSFLAGINSDGLLLIDAASGAIFDKIENISRTDLLYPFNDELYCLSRTGKLSRLAVNSDGKFFTLEEISLTFSSGGVNSFAYNNSFIFASQDNLLLLEQQNKLTPFIFNFQTRIIEIAAGRNNIALLAENGSFFILPLDYRQIHNIRNLPLINKTGYSKITSLSSAQEDRFILWQSVNTRNAPQLISADSITNAQTINSLTGRYPLRSITSMNGKISVLDNAGNLSIREAENIFGSADFSFSAAGSVETAFINNEYILISKSAVSNDNPFLFLNFKTGETIHVPYPALTGLTVYKGNSGIYAEAIELSGGITTTVLDLSSVFARTGAPNKIFEYIGETPYLSIAESGGSPAIGTGNGAFLLSNDRIEFERTSGLPVKLLGCDNFFISLDNEGSVVWHDNKSAKVLAVFSLHANQWKFSSDTEIQGKNLP